MGQKDNTQVTPLNEEQLVEKQIELDTREKTLEESENKLNEKDTELIISLIESYKDNNKLK